MRGSLPTRALPLLAGVLAAGCGASTVGEQPDAGSSLPEGGRDASTDTSTDAVTAESGGASDGGGAMVCVPGRSVACTGPGGCSSNQVCNVEGSGFGPCVCAPTTDAGRMACVPGQSTACTGPGGCISNQTCAPDGAGYGPCACVSDAGLACVPGQSIQCVGPYGCISYQMCDSNGQNYDPCVCPDGGSDDGGWPDGYAPLPPPVGNQGYNAIWAYDSNWSAPAIFLPLFSAPDCAVDPPFGEYLFVLFEPTTAGPAGAFTSCTGLAQGPGPCYSPAESTNQDFIGAAGLSYSLSAFDGNGIATGQMQTTLGIVPLVVKNCL